MKLLMVMVALYALLYLNEKLWKLDRSHGEFNRKFVHIAGGSFAATWPYFLSWDEIRLLSLAFLVVLGVSRQFNLFKGIHAVDRKTWGDVFFALSLGLLTFMTQDKAIYAAAVLQVSLADGLAAVVGTRFGKSTRYKVLGQTKSFVGTLTFLAVSYVILLAYATFTGSISPGQALALSALAAGLENVAPRGLDNTAVPVVIVLALTQF